MSRQINHLYKFGHFLLNPHEHLLLRDGEIVSLTPKALETLTLLVRRSGHVVSKDELMQTVWQDTFVEENGLTRNISVLRKVLGQSQNGGSFIETITKVGYRFTVEVKELTDDSAETQNEKATEEFVQPKEIKQTSTPSSAVRREDIRPRRLLTLILLGGLLLVGLSSVIYYLRYSPANRVSTISDNGIKSIAVLPFKPIVAESSDENLEVGIADALVTRLSNFKQLSVKPTSAVRHYAGSKTGALAAGRELGVDSVLEGSLQKSGDNLRVTVQLVNVFDGSSLWAEKYDERFTDIFAVQDAIAKKVSAALKIQMDAAEQARAYRRYTENVKAYEAYLRGRSLLTQYTKESTLASLDAFQTALSLDPNYVLARDGLATASAEMYLRFASAAEVKDWGTRAEQEIGLALAADPNLAETHQALAAIYRKKDFNWEKVIEESNRALELSPNLEQPHYYRAAAFYHLGLLEFASREAEKGADLNPQNRVDELRAKGIIALYGGRYAEAVSLLEEVQHISSKPLSDSHLAQAYYYQGEAQRAEAILNELRRSESASASTRAEAALASFLAARGARREALELLRTVEAKNYLDHHVAYSIGAAYAQLGQSAKAVGWLRRAAATGLPCYPLYESDRLLDPIRGNTDFERLLTELRELQAPTRIRYAIT